MSLFPQQIVLFVWVVLSVCLTAAVLAKVPACCQSINNAPCRRYCQQMVQMSTSIQQMQQLLTAAEDCPRNLESFWSCLNTSLPVVLESKEWPGRPCCDLALSTQCRRRCHDAHSKSEVRRSCRVGEERSLFSCLRKQEEGEACCGRSTSLSCGMVCRSHYLAGSSRNWRSPLRVLTQHCGGPGTPVGDCIQQQSPAQRPSNSSKNLHCCDLAKSQACKDSCISALRSPLSEAEIVDAMSVHCGPPSLIDRLWTCFLGTNPSNNNNTPLAARMDNAALQCCAKAVTPRCRDLCTQTFKSGWSYQSEFYKSCSYIQPVSTIEATMHKCLKDVEEPCQPGCSGLSFCSTFNNRPAELFRTCTRDADKAAEKAFAEWTNGLIRISLPQMTIPVKDVRLCEPDKWKAIACALQIKPCLKQPSLLSLCKEDCIDILNKCVDHSRLGIEQSVPQLCNALPSVKTPGACVSLAHHLRASPYNPQEGEITHPCKPNPCRGDEVCEVRRRRCKHPKGCKQFICKSACSMGQMSSTLIATGTYVRIPDPERSDAKQKDCYLGCRCDSKGQIEHCQPLLCMQRRHCTLGAGNKQEHGSHFLLDKSQCICHDMTLICSRHTCPAKSSPQHLTGSSSECSTQYKPVCGANGKTYPNSCYARCAKVNHLLSHTSCNQYDPCQDRPCGSGQRCVVRRQVCLGYDLASGTCPQYECVSKEGGCNSHFHDAACDTTGEEFSNACLLFSSHRSLAYRGHCQELCSLSGPVCGHNGETYSSQCAARASGITVDYLGACRAVGNLTVTNTPLSSRGHHTISCSRVQCPPLRPAHCQGVLPPGACCPICAAQLRALFSPRLVSVAEDRLGERLAVQHVVGALSRLITVAQCHVFGYLSLDGDLVLIVAPLALNPSDVQVEACNSEAERLEMLISHGSPTLTLYLHLSPLLLAPAQLARLNYNVPMYVRSAAAATTTALPGTQHWLTLLLSLIWTMFLWHRRR